MLYSTVWYIVIAANYSSELKEEMESVVTITMFNLFTELFLSSTLSSERAIEHYTEHLNFIKIRVCQGERKHHSTRVTVDSFVEFKQEVVGCVFRIH